MHTTDATREEGAAAAEEAGVIAVMPAGLANKIAAGEVVQRPASVAKELMENALDAGAEEVALIVKKAGRALVQVVDDGCGMSPADARLCFRRHATSKIRAVEDLERLRTLGFRGEALASIGAVAQVRLKTKRPGDAAGFRVRIDGGSVAEAAPCAAPGGTSVAVRNLFYNVPARRNFLKTDATEFKHLVETFQQQALAHPDVAFRLVHNENEVFRLPRAGDASEGGFFEALRRRIADLLGEDRADGLRRVEDEASYLAAKGFVGAVEKSRRSRREQFLFVNGRHVENRYLAHAVKSAYGALLPDGAFPFFALFLTLDPRRVDANVHPAKAEVKFEDKSGVYGFVREAARKALAAEDPAPRLDESVGADFSSFGGSEEPEESSADERRPRPAPPHSDEERSAPRDAAPPAESPKRSLGGSASSPASSARAPSGNRSLGDLSDRLYAPAGEGESPAEKRADPSGRPCWPVGGGYVAVPQDGRLLVIDAPAAHRRILYERARRHLDATADSPSQQLLFPRTVELSAAEVELFDELLPDLRRLGFDLKRFSGRTVAVRGLPAGARDEAEALLEEVLGEYRTLGEAAGRSRAERLAKSIARRGAVAREARLSAEEAQALVRALFACEMPYADPEGRPTTLKLTPGDLRECFEE